jgi:hypothetical protein
VPNSLIHPTYGEVWNITLGSLAHEHQLHKGSKYGLISNCRCRIEPKFQLTDLLYVVKKLHAEILNETQEIGDTESGGYRRTAPEDIGVTIS